MATSTGPSFTTAGVHSIRPAIISGKEHHPDRDNVDGLDPCQFMGTLVDIADRAGHPSFKGLPQRVGEEGDEDVDFDAFLTLMPDRPDHQL